MAKKNLLKVPQFILDRITSFDQDDVVAATVKLVMPDEVRHYAHLGISMGANGLVLPEPSPPNPEAGRYSQANLYGLEKVRRDLPKVSKSFGFWAPSWNSGSYPLRLALARGLPAGVLPAQGSESVDHADWGTW